MGDSDRQPTERERICATFDIWLDRPDRLRAALSAGMELRAADEHRARFYVSEVLRVDDRMRDGPPPRPSWIAARFCRPRSWRYRLAA